LPGELRSVAIKGEVPALMIEAQAILLTVSALIRCIGEGSISGRYGPSKAGQSWSGFINEKNFLFFPNREPSPLSNRANRKAGTE
jgi:hypothetical protein